MKSLAGGLVGLVMAATGLAGQARTDMSYLGNRSSSGNPEAIVEAPVSMESQVGYPIDLASIGEVALDHGYSKGEHPMYLFLLPSEEGMNVAAFRIYGCFRNEHGGIEPILDDEATLFQIGNDIYIDEGDGVNPKKVEGYQLALMFDPPARGVILRQPQLDSNEKLEVMISFGSSYVEPKECFSSPPG